MDVFLPIAQRSVNLPEMVAVGAVIGVISGLFGVGGGFLLTPLLMFLGISPTVAAASGAAGIIAGSASGTIEHSRAGTVDYKMALVLFAGGSAGGYVGVRLLHWINSLGPVNTVIRGLYVILLGIIGGVMFVDSVRTWRRGLYLSERRFERPTRQTWVGRLPWRVRFEKSEVEVSLLLPLAMGALAGALAALMGVSGGFVMVPLMLYVLDMRMHTVAGTSLFQVLLTCIVVTILQSRENFTVDPVLSFLIAAGSTVGALLGTRFGRKLRADQLKILLAVIVLAVAVSVAVGLVREPAVLLSHVAGE